MDVRTFVAQSSKYSHGQYWFFITRAHSSEWWAIWFPQLSFPETMNTNFFEYYAMEVTVFRAVLGDSDRKWKFDHRNVLTAFRQDTCRTVVSRLSVKYMYFFYSQNSESQESKGGGENRNSNDSPWPEFEMSLRWRRKAKKSFRVQSTEIVRNFSGRWPKLYSKLFICKLLAPPLKCEYKERAEAPSNQCHVELKNLKHCYVWMS